MHEGLSHRPIVTINNNNRSVVQLTPRFRFPYSDETVILLRRLMNGEGLSVGVNGNIQMVAQSGGIVRFPAGSPNIGTETHVFPIVYTSDNHVNIVENKLIEIAQKFTALVPNAEFLGFVDHHSTAILEMEKNISRMKYEQERTEWEERVAQRRRGQLHIVMADGNVMDTVGDGSSVISPHETASGYDQRGENDGNQVGAEATRA